MAVFGNDYDRDLTITLNDQVLEKDISLCNVQDSSQCYTIGSDGLTLTLQKGEPLILKQ